MTFSSWISVAAAIISALGALMVWVANKRMRRISANGQIGSLLIQLNHLMVEEPDLRPYFVEGGKLPRGKEQKAKALASMYLNLLETIWSFEGTMNDVDKTAWIKYINFQVRKVPIVNDMYEAQREWYSNLNKILDKK